MKTQRKTLRAIFLLSTITFIFFGSLTAQDQFRLSDYKNPDYKWKMLDVTFGLGGLNTFSNQEIERGTTEKETVNRIQSNFDVRYYGTKNSEFYQGYQDFRLKGNTLSDWDNNHNVTDDLEDKYQRHEQNLTLNALTVNRFYNQRKLFFEVDFNLIGEMYHANHKNSDNLEELPYFEKSKTLNYNFYGSIPLLIGKGRIEEVQDARLAVYILDDLLNSGDLKRTPTAEETMTFAKFITETKNQRFFDSRIRKIAEITAVDSILTALDLKGNSGASYYTLINDNWDNSNGPVRSTGGRFSIGFEPNINLEFEGYTGYFKDTLNNPDIIESYTHRIDNRTDSWGVGAIADYTWEKPTSLYWQHSINADITYSLYYQQMNNRTFDMDTLTSQAKSDIDSPNLALHLRYTIGYYPNSRTHVQMGTFSNFTQYWGTEKVDEEPESDVGRIFINTRIFLNCYYYISPRVRLSVYLSSIFQFTKNNQEFPNDEFGDEKRNIFQNSISASLTYSIF